MKMVKCTDIQPDNQPAAPAEAEGAPTASGLFGAIPDAIQVGTVLSSSETVSRFGSATAEYIKGYRGRDNETGQVFAKGLAGIAEHKVNADPLEAAKNIKQQAGYSAEVAATSRDNADAIINRSSIRTSRSDDLPEYGKNHNVVDRVQLLDGQIIDGTQAQMKFVGDREQLFERIAREDGKFSRYRGVKLELPSEQYEGAAAHCREKAQTLREQAAQVEKLGKTDVAEKLRREAGNYEQLANNVSDSGLTTEDALFYREHPELATARDIARTSHQAGVEAAGYSAVIGGSISILQNLFAVAQGTKSLNEATQEVVLDTAKAGALGYGTAFVGSALKGTLQQSGNQTLRTLAGTNAPALAVNICLSLGSSIKRYATGEITESQLLTEVGEKGAGMLSSGMMAALGQLAIPVPFVGAAIGGMIGYTLSSLFYQHALNAARGVEASRQQLARSQAIQGAARDRIAQEQAALDAFVQCEIPQLLQETTQLFAVVEASATIGADQLALSIDQFATLLGTRLQLHSMSEFDAFMSSDLPLTL
jgi:hypothetical protein